MVKKLLLTMALAVLPFVIFAQSGTITGTVTDAATGDELPGASVFITELERGASTNLNGEYTIENIPYGSYTIRITYVGYQATTREIELNQSQLTLNVEMRADLVGLEDVVVTGIASQRARGISEVAVSRVDASRLNEVQSYQTVNQLMSGKVAGVTVSPSSGNIGGGIAFNMRAGGGLTGDGQPIIFVDGVRVDNAEVAGFGAGGQSYGVLADLNPSDISEIDVLKGPAAAALYGTSGANGVVLITTRRGSTVSGSEVRVNYRYTGGWNTQQHEYGDDYINSAEDANAIFRDGPINQHNLSVSGGTDFIRYFTSYDRRAEDGIIRNNSMERNSFRANFDAFPSEDLTISVNTGYTLNEVYRPDNDNNIFGQLGNVLLAPGGSTYFFTDSLSVMNIEDLQRTNRFTGSVNASYQLIDNLEIRAGIGFDGSDLRQDKTYPPQFGYSGIVDGERNLYNRQNQQFTYDLSARYNYSVLENLDMSTVVGTQIFNRRLRTSFMSKQQFDTELVRNIGAGREFTGSNDEGALHVREAGIFAEQEFNWDNRIFASFGGRYDYASSIGDSAPQIFYPKASAAIRIDRYDILPEQINFMKFRVAYGETGILPGLTDGIPLLWGAQQSGFGTGAIISNVGNAEIEPERIKELELGLEMELYERLSFDFTYYQEWARETIVDFRQAPSRGFGTNDLPLNVGAIDGQGVELQVGYWPIRTRNTELNFNFIYNWQEGIVKDLGGAPPIRDSWDVNWLVEGERRYVYYMFETLGAQFDNDGNVILDASAHAIPELSDERRDLGVPIPPHSGSLSVDFRFLRNFNIYAMADFQLGAHTWDYTTRWTINMSNNVEYSELREKLGITNNDADIQAFSPGSEDYINAANRYAELNPNHDQGFLSKSDFLKLREVTVRYNFTDLLRRSGLGDSIRSLHLSVSGQNLLTFDNYSGLDPEVNFTGSRSLRKGQDFLTLQNPRVFNFTVSLGL